MAHSFGLILANRAVVLGAIKVSDLLALSAEAERAGVFDAVWVGDSLLAKPRLESIDDRFRECTVSPQRRFDDLLILRSGGDNLHSFC